MSAEQFAAAARLYEYIDRGPESAGSPCFEWEIPLKSIKVLSKVVMGLQGGNHVSMDEFRTEVALMSKMRHPNIVLFMGACTVDPAKVAIVTEFVSAGSLYTVVHKHWRSLRPEWLLRAIYDVALGMAYLHSLSPPIVHRDLKPMNILVDGENSRCKLIDFGLSMAPEVLRNEPYTERVDVYSYALVVAEVYTHQTPFVDKNVEQLNDALPEGQTHAPQGCWAALREAISSARELVLIAGWNFDPDVRLVRSGPSSSETVGELLVRKASLGVLVLLHTWDSHATGDLSGAQWHGDPDPRDYFRATRVVVAESLRLAGHRTADPRSASSVISWTHHQKSVVCDCAPACAGSVCTRRGLVAFVGGLDIARGRWDSPDHPLFGSLQGAHRGDFYNRCGIADEELGPREPWHDTCASVQGEAAWDVLVNFEQRWKKQSRAAAILSGLQHDHFCFCAPLSCSPTWNVQVVRSIDRHSASGVRVTETGIQLAYLRCIREAQESVYIENQFFIGSSDHWGGGRASQCPNGVPFELAARICRGIRDGRPVRAVVLLPAAPEGVPGSWTVREILHWQSKTLGMMFRMIAQELRSSEDPLDYLCLFCLGRRERLPEDLRRRATDERLASASRYQRAAVRAERHPIYVHSKAIVIDDRVAIVGSANLNERSLAGNRDTELAVVASGPGRPAAGFRRALWREHAGVDLPEFERPGSAEAVRALRAIAQSNYESYCAREWRPCSHLLPYPLDVSWGGSVAPRRDFPGIDYDTLGFDSVVIPDWVTS
eukprot:m51a1_g10006 putative phospholipase d beta 1-like (773) ;mRNA; r:90464-94179